MKLFSAIVILLASAAGGCTAACWGVTAEFANEIGAQSEYEASVLRQRGVNCVFLNMRGMDHNWPNWLRVERAWKAANVSCYWELPTTNADCEHITGFDPTQSDTDHRPVLEDGSRAYFGAVTPLGNFFEPMFIFQTQRIAKAMVRQLSTPAGYQFTSNVDLGNGSYDEHALASWREFLESFFGDTSPSDDTNADMGTFNAAYGTVYMSWEEVPQFTSKDVSDPAKRRLVDLWLAESFASYVDATCKGVSVMDRDALVGPGVNSVVADGVDASVLASKKGVNVIYTNDAGSIPVIASTAATFNKNVFANGVRLVPGDYAASRQRALKLLPYVSGACFDYRGLVAERTDEVPARIARFDPAFRVIPELAPFAGKFTTDRANLLWIVWEDLGNIVNAYCVSEAALALDPNCVDLSRFRAVVYRTSSPCASLAIKQRLFEYALGGGIVFIDAYNIASGPTLRGRDNAKFWWEGMKLARDSFGEGETTVTYVEKWTFPFTAPYLTRVGETVKEVGKVEDSTGASYPLLLVREIGSGKWVFVNLPGYDSQFSLLRLIVEKMFGIVVPDPSRALVYAGEKCALALSGRESEQVAIRCAYDKAGVFDPFSGTAQVVSASGGAVALPGTVEAGQARLWVVKSYGEPVVLYTDGTLDHAASIGDGKYSDNVLEFRLAERAFVSSPKAPKSLAINGKPAEFDYDPEQRLVTIERTGSMADARLEYAE